MKAGSRALGGHTRMHARMWIAGGLCALLAIVGAAASVADQGAQGRAQAGPEERFETTDNRQRSAGEGDYDRMRAAARRDGKARVIVGLRTSFTPEGALSHDRRSAQRSDIATATAEVRRALAGSSHRVIHTYETLPYIAVEVSAKALDRLQSEGLAASLQEDTADAPTLAQSTGIVEATEAVPLKRTGTGRVVAILDTGVSKTHPFLQQAGGGTKVASEACYSANGNCPGNVTESTASGSGVNCTYATDGCRHGTHVAGIAAGRGASFSGVARDARLIAIQVFSRFTGTDCANAGEDPCTLTFVSDQMKGLERVFALRNTFTIGAANMSLGGGSFTSACDNDSRKPAIDNLRSVRIPTVIASGNDGFTNAVGSPGCISTAVTVGSTNKSDAVSLFSNSSTLVDLFAPGEQINSSVPGGGFAVFDGTSMAAPHVAGAWAIARQVDSAATVTSVTSAFNATGKPITDTFAEPEITRDRIRVLSAAANLKHTGLNVESNISAAGLGVRSDGVGLARRTAANPNPTTAPPTANFSITGIPADVEVQRAYLLWQTVGGPDPTATFRGVSRTGSLIGSSGQFNCWSTNDGGAIRTYRYAVPEGEVTGNGTYSIGGVGGTNSSIHGRADGQGASLIVVYENPDSARTGRIYLRWGAMTARPGGPAMSHTFSGLSVPSAVVNPRLHVGIGDGESFADPAMLFNGGAVTATNFWSGREGNYWDDDRITLPDSSMPVGTTSRTNSQTAGSDCLTWAYSGLTYLHD
jgi:subtilisin